MEGPLNNLQPSMIQFSKPKRTLPKAMEQFRRHETSARDYMPGGTDDRELIYFAPFHTSDDPSIVRRSGTPSRFDQSFYRTHDALGYIPSDVQSLRSQATYSSGLPMFAANGPFGAGMQRGPAAKRGPYGSYASSIISQEGPAGTDNSSVVGSSVGTSDHRSTSMVYSQSDRLRRRTSFSSIAGTSDMGSLSQYDYKGQDDISDLDDVKSQYTGTQAGVTVF